MKYGEVTMAVPEDNLLYPYIGYDVRWNTVSMYLDGERYPYDKYEEKKIKQY